MRKYFLACFCINLAITAAAQEITGTRGEPILPEKGDWCLSFDAVPFIIYTGNVLNNSGSNSVRSEFPNGYENTLVLKKLKEDNRKLRIKMRIGITREKLDTIVVGLSSTSPEPSVTDSRIITRQNIAVGLGFQKSKGKGRLKGYKGLELLVKYSSKKTTYTYGDGPLTALVWTHTNTFGQGAGVTEFKEGNKVGLNLRYILGAEFFFAPKMSLSAEYSWGINYFVIGESKEVSEHWDFGSNKVKSTTKRMPRQPAFELDNFYDAASINLAFYF